MTRFEALSPLPLAGMEVMLDGMKLDFSAVAQSIASEFLTPVGPIPLERLMRLHAPTIEVFRTAGLKWDQIGRLLAQAGVCRTDGRPFSAAQLRGVYRRSTSCSAIVSQPGPEGTRPVRQAEKLRPNPKCDAAASVQRTLPTGECRETTPRLRRRDELVPDGRPVEGLRPARTQVLDLMRQSADARRSRN